MDDLANATWLNLSLSSSSSSISLPPTFSLDYRIVATTLHSLIFLLGFVGNIFIVLVVMRTKSLHTVPTYSYLVSLAVADFFTICAAMPEALVSYQLYAGQWVFGQIGCSLMIFASFLGINASSMSILVFTVERFIAICMPLKAKSVCTLERAKKINVSIWLVALVCSCPWLGLTVTRPNPRFPTLEMCSFRFPPDKYAYIFGSDILIFYVFPLLTASILYFKIALALRIPVSTTSRKSTLRRRSSSSAKRGSTSQTSWRAESPNGTVKEGAQAQLMLSDSIRSANVLQQRRSRIKVVRMLFVIVATFAALWLPYRAISLYNAFAARPIYNKWIMLFAKTCIFLNSSINPILYNAMSLRFRQASLNLILCRQTTSKPLHHPSVHSRLICTPFPSPVQRSSIPHLTVDYHDDNNITTTCNLPANCNGTSKRLLLTPHHAENNSSNTPTTASYHSDDRSRSSSDDDDDNAML